MHRTGASKQADIDELHRNMGIHDPSDHNLVIVSERHDYTHISCKAHTVGIAMP